MRTKSQVLGLGIALAVSLNSSQALADLNCRGPEGIPALKAFSLLGGGDFLGWTKNAAIILDMGYGQILLNGKVTTMPTRLGSHVLFIVKDSSGAQSHLSYSIEDEPNPKPDLESQEPQQGFKATLNHGGETYFLDCRSNP